MILSTIPGIPCADGTARKAGRAAAFEDIDRLGADDANAEFCPICGEGELGIASCGGSL